MTIEREYLKKKKIKINHEKIKVDQDGVSLLSIEKEEIALQILQVQALQVRVLLVLQSLKRKIYKRDGNKQRKIRMEEKEERGHHLHLQEVVHLRVHQVLNQNKRGEGKRNLLIYRSVSNPDYKREMEKIIREVDQGIMTQILIPRNTFNEREVTVETVKIKKVPEEP